MNVLPGRRVKPLNPGAVQKKKKPGRYADGGGLYLLVKPDGRKTWVFRWADRVTGKMREAGLGSLTGQRVTLAQARERADHFRDLVWKLRDPVAERQATLEAEREKARHTFAACMAEYIATHSDGWRNAKHKAQWTSTLNTYAARLLPLPVADITDVDVLACLKPIWTMKTETARRLRQRIEAVLDWATAQKYRKGDNPARRDGPLKQLLPDPARVQKVKPRAALPYAELPAFMAELRAKDTQAARALELQILTATRPGEVTGARWEELDLAAKLWTIPAERMKAEKEHEVPLTDAAIRLLKKQPRVSEYVFPGGRSLKQAMSTNAGLKQLKDMRPGLTQHGFRSTFRDWAGEQSAYPREVIEHALAHQLKDKAEAAYQRGTLMPKRARLMRDWSAYCASTPTAGKVTPIRKRAKA